MSRLIKKSYYYCFIGTLAIGEILALVVSKLVRFDVTTNIFVVYIALVILGAVKSRELGKCEKTLWMIGLIVSCCSFVAVGLLTNQGLLSLFAYMVPCIVISLVPIAKDIEKSGAKAFYVLAGLVLVLLLHRGITVYGYINVQGNYLITGVENVVRVGPEKGIVTSLTKCNENREGIRDYATYTNPGDKVNIFTRLWPQRLPLIHQEGAF